METFFHPVTGKVIRISELDDASAFSRTYGIEIELNTPTSNDQKRIATCKQLIQVLNRNGRHFHIMRDNSVRNGIEIVSAPMTFKYWINNFDVKEINDLFTDLNLTATIDTGLHIHVGMEHSRRMKELYLQLFSISYPLDYKSAMYQLSTSIKKKRWQDATIKH